LPYPKSSGIVYGVSRDRYKTVTLPVLVSLEKPLEEADGWVYLDRVNHRAVQVVEPKDIQERLRKIFTTPKDIFLFTGAGELKSAYDTKDVLALRRSVERVSAWVPGWSGRPWNLGTETKPNWVGVRFIYSALMTNLLRDARSVMWCSDKEGCFLPGIYCPDWKTAAFGTMFMGHLRVCPKCGDPFTPKTDNQDYCTPAHGVAYRTAKSRWWKARGGNKQGNVKQKKVRKSLR
jgi:hypothetical protein